MDFLCFTNRFNKVRFRVYYLFLLISVLGRLIEAREDITEPRRNRGEGFVDRLFGVCTLVLLPPDFSKGVE